MLATSREALGVDGEQLWPVPPLPVEDATALFVAARAGGVARLPARRGRGRRGPEICPRLDGLPLGIELAAARMRAMSPARSPAGSTTGRCSAAARAVASPRHQSLAAAIEWSYRLLPEPEQRLFARLSVFAGGATSPPRTASPTRRPARTTRSTALTRPRRPVDGGGPAAPPAAYRLLETLRAYGRDGSREADGRSSPPARRVLRRPGRAGRPRAAGPGRAGWAARVVPDYDNMRAAFLHAAPPATPTSHCAWSRP